MRILIISQYFWPESFRINDLAQGLRDGGHRVTVLTGKPNYPGGKFFAGYGFFKKAREDYQGIEVIRVPLVPRGSASGFRLVLNYLSFAAFASLLAPIRCRGNFDVIFVFEPSPITVGLPALLLKKLTKAPIAFWVQDLWPESLSATGAISSAWILKRVEGLVRYIYRGCDLILVQSEAFCSAIENLGMSRKCIRYFPNSAEALYKPIARREDLVGSAGVPRGFRVMFAGNIGVAQDFGTILDAAEKLKPYTDIHWLIVGDGRMLPWVKEQAEKRGVVGTFHFLGRQPMESMPHYFSAADVMLATLKKEPIFSLTIPAKVQSYLACGKPLIAALEGEGARIVREAGAGLTPSAENSEELAGAILEMYRMGDAERQAMGERGRKYFEAHFERHMLLERLEGWFSELINKTI